MSTGKTKVGLLIELSTHVPLYHIYGMLILGFSLASRAHLVLLPKFEPLPFLEAMQRHRITGAST